jgi:two-component sensor histidine kinase
VSELVTNSVLHAGLRPDQEIEVAIDAADRVRVEVADHGRGVDEDGGGATDERDGRRGLFLVGLLATRWGVERSDRARVWFELD